MKPFWKYLHWTFAVMLLAGGMDALGLPAAPPDFWPALENAGSPMTIKLLHPYEGAIMPSNILAPVLHWKTNNLGVESWVAGIKAGAGKWVFEGIQPMWHPPENDWQRIKAAATGGKIEIILGGYTTNGPVPNPFPVRGSVRFVLSGERMDWPLFYREVNLPFAEAVKDPSKIHWRFGPIDRPEGAPVVLQHLPVCGNCHSFSKNGEYLAMDVDYANNKASYVITRTEPQMRLATSDIITWDDYRREDGQLTFGLLSQISPDGRYVLSTVKDRSVFVPRPDLAFSQLFFPIQGIIAVYDREEKRYFALPGADDPAFVQSNPTWSPDGQTVIFARNRAAKLQRPAKADAILLTSEECEEFLKGKEFKFDLYRLPFNGGKGGKAEPVQGASANGRSNYFPKYSPDGHWIVFCEASNYMLLQPDSELFIIPAEGGEARRLGCNLGRMNSWHTWSPDGRWLVFSSKEHSDYTQLYLSHMSPDGEASPPVWLSNMVAPGRAANIPEFVNLPSDAIVKINEQFLDDYSYTRVGNQLLYSGDADKAMDNYLQALSLNPDNAMAQQRLGFLLLCVKHRPDESIPHSETAVRLEPRNGFAHFDLGSALAERGDLTNAAIQMAAGIELLPNGYDRQYNVVDMNFALAMVRFRLGLYTEVLPPLQRVLNIATNYSRANFLMAMTLAATGETESALPFYQRAIQSDPSLARSPDFQELLSRNYIKQGAYSAALRLAEEAIPLAIAAGRQQQAARLQQTVDYCRLQTGNK